MVSRLCDSGRFSRLFFNGPSTARTTRVPDAVRQERVGLIAASGSDIPVSGADKMVPSIGVEVLVVELVAVWVGVVDLVEPFRPEIAWAAEFGKQQDDSSSAIPTVAVRGDVGLIGEGAPAELSSGRVPDQGSVVGTASQGMQGGRGVVDQCPHVGVAQLG